MTTPNNSVVLTTVAKYVTDCNRPCPVKHLSDTFGTDVLDVVDALKKEGALVGLRGRNGGLALPDSPIVAKRAEHAAKKAARSAAKAVANG